MLDAKVTDPKVIVALDYDNHNEALAFVDRIEPGSCRLKVGKEMFTFFGPDFVRQLHDRGHSVFLDLKFHDIPNTCSKAVRAAAELGVWMVNVHASGGERMMTASREILEPYGKDRPLLIGVTVLTSMEASDLAGIGIACQPQQQVLNLATLTKNSGLDGVVCSAQEASLLKAQLGQQFKLVTPGIRPVGSDAGDQRRVMTPVEAIGAGSDYLVIGRPITQASDPAAVLAAINKTLA
ncbi:orotidine-5'-phosphate decarboxylase [Photobacterium iliopiscarium]|jgi:orotidine-5'-phosphate decarboxylase|uniref:Orotidine 5'-phosphate decarboxylase n=1 Tax=Photobacterium iliopiscarium TaxID=56192 RepID=A0A2T3MKB0_9GAMM|nr:orotidine-5'-phosphate decarboxylase [Photobacterium iliopiscarium]KJG14664.1 orotidine 5'-phosphate decarboxylase [Photobacterium iliopiscarium]PST97207.1 orotidine-5'-phosphate decarboxylase [Photobacterium iliopiscarium]PSU01863.1 orotidine-5'-phosphate decarboxylase [Photobacterium iliopiscarium]PSV84211.1 orotidine-5'-phosphate decarboxylase [Photobacterium iliopiscarium]PSV96605.1 orotidine-5'-phosphate decarboxylase [Photobacterium iliopiscarium]